ncbi:MAG TPA: hypothetical protein VFY48_10055 [Solirubrobacterales bacterium]|nr:hypothetical protein [Solirubrobacterales bacterium]
MGEEKPKQQAQNLRFSEYFKLWRGGGNDDESLKARILFLGTIRDFGFFVIAVVIPVAAGSYAVANHGEVPLEIGLLIGYLELVWIFAVMVSRMRLRDLQATRRSQEFEDQIFKGSQDTPVVLFLKHQSDLKRYYDQALQHSSLVFFLGIFCVLAGLATIGVALYLVVQAGTESNPDQVTEQIITGSLGAVGAILSGFVAQVYLGIHRGAIESLNDFHDKLVGTHHLHFAGVLAARVEDETTKDQAHLELVKRVPAAHLAVASENPSTELD